MRQGGWKNGKRNIFCINSGSSGNSGGAMPMETVLTQAMKNEAVILESLKELQKSYDIPIAVEVKKLVLSYRK